MPRKLEAAAEQAAREPAGHGQGEEELAEVGGQVRPGDGDEGARRPERHGQAQGEHGLPEGQAEHDGGGQGRGGVLEREDGEQQAGGERGRHPRRQGREADRSPRTSQAE
jgi:hypothetical protein